MSKCPTHQFYENLHEFGIDEVSEYLSMRGCRGSHTWGKIKSPSNIGLTTNTLPPFEVGKTNKVKIVSKKTNTYDKDTDSTVILIVVGI